MRVAMFWMALVVLLASAGQASAEPPAGMVLYFKSGGEVYLLLAEHRGGSRGWAGFGGGAVEGESVAQTAARKGDEESRGYFKQAALLKKIEGQTPLVDGDFAFYFAEVDFVPAQRVMNHPVPEETDEYLERSTFAWIPFSAVAPHLKGEIDRNVTYEIDPVFLPAGSRTTWFWTAWLRNMKMAVESGALPW